MEEMDVAITRRRQVTNEPPTISTTCQNAMRPFTNRRASGHEWSSQRPWMVVFECAV
jgi:hypothetical protein